jgi:hypothetical protein
MIKEVAMTLYILSTVAVAVTLGYAAYVMAGAR